MHHRVERLTRVPLLAIAALTSMLCSRRMAAIATLVFAGVLAWGPWLRPPLSRDFRGTQVTWNLDADHALDPFTDMATPRPQPIGSIGVTLLTFIATGIALVLVRPQWTCMVFGGLLVISAAAWAAGQFNHPTLNEAMHLETQQRSEMRRLFALHHEDLLTGMSPDRIAEWIELEPPSAPVGMNLESASRFQIAGPRLTALAGLAFIAATTGTWRRRSMIVITGALAVIVSVAGVTWRRALMEHHVQRAYAWEMRDDYTSARQSLLDAIHVFPDFANTRRYWIASGRIAHRMGQSGADVDFFLAHQLLLHNEIDEALGLLQPWSRQTHCPWLLRDLHGQAFSRKALNSAMDGNPSGSASLWAQSCQVAPWQRINWIGHGIAMAMSSQPPERIERALMPQLPQIGDRLICADAASVVGDAYFRTGDFTRARLLYQQSRTFFSLPKYVNIHAQEGMLGM